MLIDRSLNECEWLAGRPALVWRSSVSAVILESPVFPFVSKEPRVLPQRFTVRSMALRRLFHPIRVVAISRSMVILFSDVQKDDLVKVSGGGSFHVVRVLPRKGIARFSLSRSPGSAVIFQNR